MSFEVVRKSGVDEPVVMGLVDDQLVRSWSVVKLPGRGAWLVGGADASGVT
jgi:hypothetical protein